MPSTSITFRNLKRCLLAGFLLAAAAPAGSALAVDGVCVKCSYCTTRSDSTGCPRSGCTGGCCSGGGGSSSGGASTGPGIFGVIFGGARSNYYVTPDSSPSLLSKLFKGTLFKKRSRSSSSRTRWTPPARVTTLRDATRLLAREDFAGAEAGFKSAISYGDGGAASCKGLGWAQLKLGKRAEAIASLEEARRRGDAQAAELLAYAHCLGGNELFALGDFAGARKAYQDALAANPKDADALRELPRVTSYLDAKAQRDQLMAGRAPVDLRTVDFGAPSVRIGGGSTALAQAGVVAAHGADAVAATTDEQAKHEASIGFDTASPAGSVIVSLPAPPTVAAAASPLAAVAAADTPTPATSPAPLAVAAIPTPRPDPVLEKERATLDVKVTAVKAKEAALAAQPASPARDVELAKVRIERSNAESARGFVDIAAALTARAPVAMVAPDSVAGSFRESEAFYALQTKTLTPLNDGGHPIDAPGLPAPGLHGLVGGTTWTYGFQWPRENCDPKCTAEIEKSLQKQLELFCSSQGDPKKCIKDGLPFSKDNYDFVVSMGSAHSAVQDLATRVLWDGPSFGEFTRQHKEIFASLKGRDFETLDCHSNGAMLCLAALRSGDTTAKEVRLFGPQINPEAAARWKEYAATTGTRITIYINNGDPVAAASWKEPAPQTLVGKAVTAAWLLHPITGTAAVSDALFHTWLDSKTGVMDATLTAAGFTVRRFYNSSNGCHGTPDIACHSMLLYEKNLELEKNRK